MVPNDSVKQIVTASGGVNNIININIAYENRKLRYDEYW